MADTGNQFRGHQAAGNVAYRPSGAEHAEGNCAETFRRTSDRQDQAVDSTGKQQERQAKKQRTDGQYLA